MKINKNKVILDLCGGTGSWSHFYKEAGYTVIILTLPDYDVRKITFKSNAMYFEKQGLDYYDDLCICYEDVYGILAAPPCTEFSVLNCKAAARQRNEQAGLAVVNACMEIINRCTNAKFWALENPRGFLRKYLGQPKLTFQPWFYGDAWTKTTDIWGNFEMLEVLFKSWDDVPKLDLYTRKGRDKPNFAFLHKSAQAKIPQLQGVSVKTDAAFRAITPPGFAKAFFEANK